MKRRSGEHRVLVRQLTRLAAMTDSGDDNDLFSTCSLPSPVTWQGSHTECVIAAMSVFGTATMNESTMHNNDERKSHAEPISDMIIQSLSIDSKEYDIDVLKSYLAMVVYHAGDMAAALNAAAQGTHYK
ncbi:hypothetical protein Tco_0099815 [Tanacetum coccineum]